MSVFILLQESLFCLFFLQSFNDLPLFMAPAREVISQGKKISHIPMYNGKAHAVAIASSLLSVYACLILLKYWSMVHRAGDFFYGFEAWDHSLFLQNLLVWMQKQQITQEEGNFGGCWKHRSPYIYCIFVQSTCLGNRLFHAAKAVIFKDHFFQDQVTLSVLSLCSSHTL